MVIILGAYHIPYEHLAFPSHIASYDENPSTAMRTSDTRRAQLLVRPPKYRENLKSHHPNVATVKFNHSVTLTATITTNVYVTDWYDIIQNMTTKPRSFNNEPISWSWVAELSTPCRSLGTRTPAGGRKHAENIIQAGYNLMIQCTYNIGTVNWANFGPCG